LQLRSWITTIDRVCCCWLPKSFRFSILLNSKSEKLQQLRNDYTACLSELTRWKPAQQEEHGLDAEDLALQDTQVGHMFSSKP